MNKNIRYCWLIKKSFYGDKKIKDCEYYGSWGPKHYFCDNKFFAKRYYNLEKIKEDIESLRENYPNSCNVNYYFKFDSMLNPDYISPRRKIISRFELMEIE